jgi:hypothetical protein
MGDTAGNELIQRRLPIQPPDLVQAADVDVAAQQHDVLPRLAALVIVTFFSKIQRPVLLEHCAMAVRGGRAQTLLGWMPLGPDRSEARGDRKN